jgi:hypothetical protein
MEQLKGGILITPKEIQALTGYSLNAAQKEHKAVRDAIGKRKSKRLTVKEYCEYFELDWDEVVRYLNPYR